jgi:hypothetical protein
LNLVNEGGRQRKLTGVGAVEVLAVTPKQEQALEYLTAPEQADAYAGTVGEAATERLTLHAGPGVIVVVVKTVVAEGVTVVAKNAAQSDLALAT